MSDENKATVLCLSVLGFLMIATLTGHEKVVVFALSALVVLVVVGVLYDTVNTHRKTILQNAKRHQKIKENFIREMSRLDGDK